MTDDEYFEFCLANPKLRIERTSQGEIAVIAPVGGDSSFRNVEVTAQLRNRSRMDKRGKSFDSSVEFILENGAALSPDASWFRTRGSLR